jgi:tetratricopeptide (TPR) repeat protein
VCIEVERAVNFYRKAGAAMKLGNTELAEVYYLQSVGCFEKAGNTQRLNAANALNALAQLHRLRGNYSEALRAAKAALQIMEQCKIQSADADLIRETAWDLIEMVGCEL